MAHPFAQLAHPHSSDGSPTKLGILMASIKIKTQILEIYAWIYDIIDGTLYLYLYLIYT
jgi:hypothetical protein